VPLGDANLGAHLKLKYTTIALENSSMSLTLQSYSYIGILDIHLRVATAEYVYIPLQHGVVDMTRIRAGSLKYAWWMGTQSRDDKDPQCRS
jgi:hypothetical protein